MTPVEAAAVEKTLRTATTLLGKIFGPAMEEFGLMIGDNMKVRRLKNQIKNFEKIEKIIRNENISTKKIDLKALVPYLNNVSLEEDETLQDMWAHLMVNYLDSSRKLTTTVYPGILSQLSSDEVRMLDTLRRGFGSPSSLFKNWPIVVNDEPMLNLIRLGLVEHKVEDQLRVTQNHGTVQKWRFKSDGRYELTKFGRAFLAACER